MDTFFWVILIVVVVGIVWWLLNRSNSPKSRQGAAGSDAPRADGALSSGSAAASAEAAGTTSIPSAAGFGRATEPAPPAAAGPAPAEEVPATGAATDPSPADATHPQRTGSGSTEAASASVANPAMDTASDASSDDRRRQDQAEWETQWSEAGGAPAARTNEPPAPAATPVVSAQPGPEVRDEQSAPAAAPVHHPEYTEPHAPTLPGAETAAVEEAVEEAGGRTALAAGSSGSPATAPRAGAAETTGSAGVPAVALPSDAAAAETLDRAQSSALVETGADHDAGRQEDAEATAGGQPDPAGHLAAAEPYGAGSAAAEPDGSGPDGYSVKGDGGAMVYYEEGHPEYDETRADVWFESAAHAEAAGFRAPRRRRL